ncbi:CBS domain-containing protein [Noviherbaspirillum massiliense]|uniref:CBS domain-containing protein n=1 Tax=Noviherbaspirillum massiliense TaxID=1465823 RepID=UPI0002E36746|nr:CBS domain-containing protein [Noviherbaspirillum massiliense]
MQMVSQVMTRDVRFVSPQESLQRAAQMMDEMNVGALPVCDGDRLVGMVTDRDITIRGTAAGKAPQDCHVDEVMSSDVRWCFEDQSLDDVMQRMADTQIRRVPVVSHDDAHRLIGIVSLGDVVTKASGRPEDVDRTMEKISTPSEPDRSPAGTGGGSPAAGAAAAGGTGLGSAADAGDTRAPEIGTPAGTDAAGASGASGGTASTTGTSGPRTGPRP